MKNCEEWVDYFGLVATEEQLMAARHLELRGLVFMVDFGLDDCVQKLFESIEGADGTEKR